MIYHDDDVPGYKVNLRSHLTTTHNSIELLKKLGKVQTLYFVGFYNILL